MEGILPDAPNDVLAQRAGELAALERLRANKRSGQNASMLRATVAAINPPPATAQKPAAPAQVPKPKSAIFAPGL